MPPELPNTFICTGCGHELPADYSLNASGFCYLCDPAISLSDLLANTEVSTFGCVDGGTCHHQCETNSANGCYRRRSCAPIGDYSGPWRQNKSTLSPEKLKALEIALKHNQHPIFQRQDIQELAEAAFMGKEYLDQFDLSATEIDNLMSGLNIARDY